MRSEHDVIQELRALNRVTDLSTLELPHASSTAFLDAFQMRREPMSVQTEVKADALRRPPSRFLAFAAATAIVAIAVVVTIWLIGNDESDVAATPAEVANEYTARYAAGDISSQELLTPAGAAAQRDFAEGLAVWNHGGEVEQCAEVSATKFACSVLASDDFHAIAGLNPYRTQIVIGVNSDGVIDNLDFSVEEWPAMNLFHTRFANWMRSAHEAEYSAMGGIPMNEVMNTEAASIALQYVEEFVAQSDRYPVTG